MYVPKNAALQTIIIHTDSNAAVLALPAADCLIMNCISAIFSIYYIVCWDK